MSETLKPAVRTSWNFMMSQRSSHQLSPIIKLHRICLKSSSVAKKIITQLEERFDPPLFCLVDTDLLQTEDVKRHLLYA